jgi:hypothetical protein
MLHSRILPAFEEYVYSILANAMVLSSSSKGIFPFSKHRKKVYGGSKFILLTWIQQSILNEKSRAYLRILQMEILAFKVLAIVDN